MKDYRFNIDDCDGLNDVKNLHDQLYPCRIYTITGDDFSDLKTIYKKITTDTYLLKNCRVNIIIQELSSINDSIDFVKQLIDINC